MAIQHIADNQYPLFDSLHGGRRNTALLHAVCVADPRQPFSGKDGRAKIAHPKLHTTLRCETEGVWPAAKRFTPQQLEYWRLTTSNPWVIETLTNGYRLQFRRRPPLNSGLRATRVTSPELRSALLLEIQSLLDKNAIEEIDPKTQKGVFSTYFVVPKKDGGLRPVLDLRRLNTYLKQLPFRMLRTTDVLHSIEPRDWFVTVDLKDAYFHVPITPQHRLFLRFHFEGRSFQFKVLPFGLSLAPRVFTKCMREALAPLLQQGMRILPYLDDWLLCAQSPAQAKVNTQRLLNHISALGLSVNFEKSKLQPMQSIDFIGIHLNSISQQACLTQGRMRNILGLVRRVMSSRTVRYCLLLRLAGMLAAATPLIQLGRLHLRPFQRWLKMRRLSAQTQKNVLVAITPKGAASLHQWARSSFLLRGVSLGPPPARREVVTTDASQHGWGGVWNHKGVHGIWQDELRAYHINYLELQAVWLTLQHFQEPLEHKHVLVRTDNTSTVYHINHQGGVRSLTLNNLTRRIWLWADVHLLSLRAIHVPVKKNQAADALSRGRPLLGEWRLNPEVVQMIWNTYGKAEVDLFATRTTTHCQKYRTK